MTSAQVVETSVKVTTNSPSQNYTHPDDHNLRTYNVKCRDRVAAGVKFWRDLVHFQIAREAKRLSVLKRSFEVKLGILLRIRSYENIAGGFLFTCSFQSPKNPIFTIFVDT